jgi:hypothetical protein
LHKKPKYSNHHKKSPAVIAELKKIWLQVHFYGEVELALIEDDGSIFGYGVDQCSLTKEWISVATESIKALFTSTSNGYTQDSQS